MYILDTDILTISLRYPEKHPRLLEKIQSTSRKNLWISVVSIREMMRGALDVVKREEHVGKLARGYDFLLRVTNDLILYPVLAFDDQAEKIYKAMTASVKRIGARDCQIAATAISLGFIVITRNTRDFQRIPDVKFEDWTA